MRKKGFEPSQALSHWSLNPARLTAPALPHHWEWENAFDPKVYTSLASQLNTSVGLSSPALPHNSYKKALV
jgi:hypothetical protein